MIYESILGTVSDADAVETATELASREGILCGISSGAVILAMLPDTGERYLSTVLFEGISDGGDPEP